MKRKVLVTDDDAAVQTMLKRMLARHGFDVACAYHGLEALQIAKRETPDIILMDVNMPGLKGGDVLQELRSQFRTRMIPVIFLTGMNAKEDVVRGLSLGADDYLCKPFDEKELVARIDASLRRSSINLDANPLTRLPGNRAIDREIGERLSRKKPFSVLHADLNKFKSYNDLYGFHRGDAVIQETARILEEMAGENTTMVGHLGGDDFIVVTDSQDVQILCENIVRTFDERREAFYSEDEKKAADPLLSLGIGVVNVHAPVEWTLESISSTGAEVKTAAKNLGKSGYVVDEKRAVRHAA